VGNLAFGFPVLNHGAPPTVEKADFGTDHHEAFDRDRRDR
jgi:hypothetical protein